MVKGRVPGLMVLCAWFVLAGCGDSTLADTSPLVPSALSDGGFPTAGDVRDGSNPTQANDVPSGADAAVVENDLNSVDGEDGLESSPYECEPFSQEECVTACGTKGSRKCIKQWGPCVVPEICNGIDDDCNGIIDDGPDGAPTEEMCDGLDNDCDGEVDEGLFQECACQGVVVSKVACVDGVYPACPEPQPATQLVEIPYLAPNCPFNQGDNLGLTQGVLAARVEQEVFFSFPEDHLICSIALSGASDDFYYDDHIILTLNDVVLISSTNVLELFETKNGLPIYSWQAIVGENAGGGGGPACLSGATVCQMPGTQQNGEVGLAFDEETSDLLVQTGQGVDHKFTAIVTGDNDPAIDCHHNGLTISVDYTYLAKLP
jgi:hypothetical protein